MPRNALVTPVPENGAHPRPRPIGLRAILGVFGIVAVIGLLLVAFYKPFPMVTVTNAANHPLEDVTLQTLGSETQAETHELGAIPVGQSLEVTVRSYEVSVRELKFKLEGNVIQHATDPLPLKQGQEWRLTVEPNGKVIGTLVY